VSYSGRVAVPPSEPVPPGDPEPRRARPLAESFGLDAERYDRTRPRYPQALVDRIASASPGPDVVDVGIGTGVSALSFREIGCRVLGVEPDERMAEFARHRGFEVEVARFEDWNPVGRSFDAVISGQAWHWVDPIAGAAKAAEVLRPDGRLALFWNVFQPPPDVAEAFNAVYGRVLGGAAGNFWTTPLVAYSTGFTKAADGMRKAAVFGNPEQWRFDWERSYTRDEWVEQVPTFGGHSQFPSEKLNELLAGIGTAIDAVGGSFSMGYAAVVVTAALTPAA
jgi:SAM-dependent methyltransferase